MATRARITLAADDTTGPAFASLRQRLGQVQSTATGLGRGFAGIAGGLTAILGGAGITAFVRKVTDGLGALKDLSEATGASVENLSALEDVALKTGTSFETVGDALVKLNQALNNSDNPEIAKVLDAIGLSAKELKALDPAQALLKTATALDQFAEGGGRARAEQLLFGRSLRDIAPVLRDIAEAGELNGKVTKQQVEEADRFNNQLSRLSKEATDAARDIAGPLVSSLNDFFNALDRARKNPNGLLSGIGDKLNVDFIRARLQATNDEIERLAAGAVPRAQGILAKQPDSIRAKATLAEFAQLQKAAEAYRAEIDKILYDGGKRRPANEGGGSLRKAGLVVPDGNAAPKPKAPPDPIQGLIDASTGAQFDKLIDLSAQLDARFQAGKISGTDYARALEVIDKQLDALAPKSQTATDALGEFIDKIEQGRAASIDSLISESTGARFDAVATQAQLLSEAWNQGAITAEQLARGVEVLGQKFDALNPKVEKTMEEVSTFAEQAGRNIQDALGDSVLASLSGSTQSIGRIWGDMIKKLVAQAAAAQLGKWLLGDSFSKTGQVGGALAGLFSMFGGARAAGGPVDAGKAYLVGERGPEWMVPRNAGTVLSSGTPLAVAGGSTFNVNVQGDASENTIRLIRGALAQFEAKQMMRGAY